MDTASIAPLDLSRLLFRPSAPLVLDVRREPAYQSDPRLLASARRPAGDLADFARARAAPGARVVAYCVHGHEVSRDAAATLKREGFDAAFLEGGLEAWTAAGLPTVRARPEWNVPGGSRWVTRERPKVDRVACPWLVRRFIDPEARFDYVKPDRVLDHAREHGGIAFDTKGAPIHHRGERCSFDAVIEDFALADPALDRLATIVRGADTDRLDLAPESAGLLAACLDLSRRYSDDHEMLEQAMALYDGLYAWCADSVARRSGPRAWTPA